MPNTPLPDHDVTAQGWEKVAAALEPARDAWLTVSPESAGPVTELLRHARWNASVFQHLSRGTSRSDAWRAADAEHGRAANGYINYERSEDSYDDPFP